MGGRDRGPGRHGRFVRVRERSSVEEGTIGEGNKIGEEATRGRGGRGWKQESCESVSISIDSTFSFPLPEGF